jgi:hypothetical protein
MKFVGGFWEDGGRGSTLAGLWCLRMTSWDLFVPPILDELGSSLSCLPSEDLAPGPASFLEEQWMQEAIIACQTDYLLGQSL